MNIIGLSIVGSLFFYLFASEHQSSAGGDVEGEWRQSLAVDRLGLVR